jgi:chitin disaccharide deacetylase
MKYLITNADDFGYRPDISKAIIDAHANGCLTSTTVLVNFVSAEDVELVKQAPNLGLGLHLNLTSGEPLTDQWRKKHGSFSRPHRNESDQFDREVWMPFFEKFSTEDVMVEYDAQLQKFQQLFGRLPTHIDSHHYSSSYAATFSAYIELAKKYSLPVRRPKIWAVAAEQHPMGNITDAEVMEKNIATENVKTTTFFSLKYLNRYENYLDIFESELAQVKDGESIEVSFHPGYEEEWRVKDLEILKDPEIKTVIERNGFELVRFDQF